MTNIEQKALALALEVRADDKYRVCKEPTVYFALWEALCRAIEQHERFREEVSDDVALAISRTQSIKGNSSFVINHMHKYLITKPVDPLVEVIKDLSWDETTMADEWAVDLRAALAKRGGRIVFDD